MKHNLLSIIQLYAPISLPEDEEITAFYKLLEKTLKMRKSSEEMLIMDGFNRQIRQRNSGENDTFGTFNYGRKNDAGWKLLRFCQENNLKIVNSLFKKRVSRRWSWLSPNSEHHTLIDYILTTTLI